MDFRFVTFNPCHLEYHHHRYHCFRGIKRNCTDDGREKQENLMNYTTVATHIASILAANDEMILHPILLMCLLRMFSHKIRCTDSNSHHYFGCEKSQHSLVLPPAEVESFSVSDGNE